MDDDRRTAIATTVFSTWVVLGLFIDGWAHNAGKPEDFWTPWHAVLYSGFAAAAVWFVVERRRQRRAGSVTPPDPLTVAGFVLFAVAGFGDAVWHSVLGVEEDVAALLSPTHLALMVGGLLLICGPLRAVGVRETTGTGRRGAIPQLVAITLAVAVVGFFLQFLSPFHGIHPEHYGAGATELGRFVGIASVLITNLLVVAAVAFATARRDGLPQGSFTFVLVPLALLWSSLEGFAGVELAGAAAGAGIVADTLAARGAARRTLLVATPATLWLAWFAIYDVRWGLEWPAEYWTGVTLLAVLTGWGVDLLMATPRPVEVVAPAEDHPGVEPQLGPADRGVPTPATAGS